jgi:ParB family chromosome partitioning protein
MPDAATPSTEPKRRALGRGLDALLPPRPGTAAPKPAVPAEPVSNGKPLDIDVSAIDRNPFQTRTQFDETALTELAQSITFNGVVQPIVVRALPEGRYQLITGERRWLASRIAGKTTIPAIVREVSDEQTMEMTIVENLQRADLNPMEQARAFERLGRDFRLTQEQMAQRTGKDRASVTNYLRLLKLPEVVQAFVESGQISYGHARALLALDSPASMKKATEIVLESHLSVRQTEQFVKRLLEPNYKQEKTTSTEEIDANVKEAQMQLQRALGLKVRIEDRNGKGRVIIDYSSVEDFDAILEALGE